MGKRGVGSQESMVMRNVVGWNCSGRQVASVGLTGAEEEEAGRESKVGKLP